MKYFARVPKSALHNGLYTAKVGDYLLAVYCSYADNQNIFTILAQKNDSHTLLEMKLRPEFKKKYSKDMGYTMHLCMDILEEVLDWELSSEVCVDNFTYRILSALENSVFCVSEITNTDELQNYIPEDQFKDDFYGDSFGDEYW